MGNLLGALRRLWSKYVQRNQTVGNHPMDSSPASVDRGGAGRRPPSARRCARRDPAWYADANAATASPRSGFALQFALEQERRWRDSEGHPTNNPFAAVFDDDFHRIFADGRPRLTVQDPTPATACPQCGRAGNQFVAVGICTFCNFDLRRNAGV